MSRNGSMKEAILGIYLKERPDIISEVLGFEVDHLALEQKYGAYHVDVKAVDKKRRIPTLFELQVTPANKAYLNRLKKMITSTQEGVIVWIAHSFDEAILNELQFWLNEKQPAYTDFYAISLNEDTLTILQQLNDMYKLDIYENLHLLDGVEPLLSIVLQRKRIPMNHCSHQSVEPIKINPKITQDLKRALLLWLREKLPFYLNLHYDKKMNQYDHLLTIGAGKYGVAYRCSATDHRGRAFVELYFDRCLKEEYEALKMQKEALQKAIHPDLTFNKRRIGVYFTPANTYEQTFEQITDIFRNMIKTFSPYFYGGKLIEINLPVAKKVEVAKSNGKFVSMPFEIEERDYETEDSYRIRLESLEERFSGYY